MWVEKGEPVKHFKSILLLKRTDALSIYSEFQDWLKKKDLQCNKLVMKIALESTEALFNEDLETIVTVWDRKPRRITV